MGDEVVSATSNPHINNTDGGGNSTISFTEIFYKHLPYYLAIGMTWDEYWNQDVCRVISYRKMDEIKKRRNNESLWLQGAYVYNALCSASPLFHSFAKHPKPLPYLKEPMAITKEMQEEKEKENFNKMLNKMKALASKNKEE